MQPSQIQFKLFFALTIVMSGFLMFGQVDQKSTSPTLNTGPTSIKAQSLGIPDLTLDEQVQIGKSLIKLQNQTARFNNIQQQFRQSVESNADFKSAKAAWEASSNEFEKVTADIMARYKDKCPTCKIDTDTLSLTIPPKTDGTSASNSGPPIQPPATPAKK